MNRWVLLPYDDSPVAREVVRRVARYIRGRGDGDTGMLLAIAALDLNHVSQYVERGTREAGAGISVTGRLIGPGDAGQGLCRLAESLPDVELAVVVSPSGAAHWSHWAVRDALRRHSFPTVVFIVDGAAMAGREQPDEDTERRRVARPLDAVLRGCSRLGLGVRALVGGAR